MVGSSFQKIINVLFALQPDNYDTVRISIEERLKLNRYPIVEVYSISNIEAYWCDDDWWFFLLPAS